MPRARRMEGATKIASFPFISLDFLMTMVWRHRHERHRLRWIPSLRLDSGRFRCSAVTVERAGVAFRDSGRTARHEDSPLEAGSHRIDWKQRTDTHPSGFRERELRPRADRNPTSSSNRFRGTAVASVPRGLIPSFKNQPVKRLIATFPEILTLKEVSEIIRAHPNGLHASQAGQDAELPSRRRMAIPK
jgi:hypothetical protein